MIDMRMKKGQMGTTIVMGVVVAIVIAIVLAVSSFLTFTIHTTIQSPVNNESLGSGLALYTVAEPPFVENSETVWNDTAHAVQLVRNQDYTPFPTLGQINVTNSSFATGDYFTSYTSGALTEEQGATFTGITNTSNQALQLLAIVIIALAAAAIIGIIISMGVIRL